MIGKIANPPIFNASGWQSWHYLRGCHIRCHIQNETNGREIFAIWSDRLKSEELTNSAPFGKLQSERVYTRLSGSGGLGLIGWAGKIWIRFRKRSPPKPLAYLRLTLLLLSACTGIRLALVHTKIIVAHMLF